MARESRRRRSVGNRDSRKQSRKQFKWWGEICRFWTKPHRSASFQRLALLTLTGYRDYRETDATHIDSNTRSAAGVPRPAMARASDWLHGDFVPPVVKKRSAFNEVSVTLIDFKVILAHSVLRSRNDRYRERQPPGGNR